MKKVVSIFILSIILPFNYAHSGEPYVPKENEEYYGTWVNEEYNNVDTYAKWVINSNGTWAGYDAVWLKDVPSSKGSFKIIAKWKDQNGDVWYKTTWKNETWGQSGYDLIHISDSGSTMEAASYTLDFPTKIDPTKPWPSYLGIHHRQ